MEEDGEDNEVVMSIPLSLCQRHHQPLLHHVHEVVDQDHCVAQQCHKVKLNGRKDKHV